MNDNAIIPADHPFTAENECYENSGSPADQNELNHHSENSDNPAEQNELNHHSENSDNPAEQNELNHHSENSDNPAEQNELNQPPKKQYMDLRTRRSSQDADNERMFFLHQKSLQQQQLEKVWSNRPQTRSPSEIRRAVESLPSNFAYACGSSHLHPRSIVPACNSHTTRSPSMNRLLRSSAALTEGERIALGNMIEREERRQSVLMRAANESEASTQILIEQKIEKESASLHRLVEKEKKRNATLKEHQIKRINRMNEAKKRRDAMENERQKKLESLRLRREQRVGNRDPYAMFAVKQRYSRASPSTSYEANKDSWGTDSPMH